MSDAEPPTNPDLDPDADAGSAVPRSIKIVDPGVPAVLAHRLAHWSKDTSGLLVLTFAEERADLADPTRPTIAVCARVALPMRALEETLRFLETAMASQLSTMTTSATMN